MELSGAEGACEGPKVWSVYQRHPSGGFQWKGCPRVAVTRQTDALLAHYDRSGGRLSATEQRLAPWALLDAYGEIAFVQALREWEAAENAKARG